MAASDIFGVWRDDGRAGRANSNEKYLAACEIFGNRAFYDTFSILI